MVAMASGKGRHWMGFHKGGWWVMGVKAMVVLYEYWIEEFVCHFPISAFGIVYRDIYKYLPTTWYESSNCTEQYDA